MGVVPDPVRPLVAPADAARRVEEMYKDHARLVRSICRSLLRDGNDADDAVQQTFLSAQRALANGSTPREPAAWLAVIARNECLARVRQRMREPLPVDAEPTEVGGDAYSAAVSRYEVATLREALADLPRAQREAILLRELRGLSYDEVARALSLTTGAVESLIFRARRTLQVKLSEALPALSPVALFARLFGGGGSDLAGPAVAKVVVIGVGAAMLAGGAALGPRTLGLGHGGSNSHHATAPASAQTGAKNSSPWSARLLSTPAFVVADTKREREAGSKETGSSDSRESAGSESSGSDGASSEGSGSDNLAPDSPSAESSRSDGSSSESDTTSAPASTVPAPPETDTSTIDTSTDTSTDPTETTDTGS